MCPFNVCGSDGAFSLLPAFSIVPAMLGTCFDCLLDVLMSWASVVQMVRPHPQALTMCLCSYRLGALVFARVFSISRFAPVSVLTCATENQRARAQRGHLLFRWRVRTASVGTMSLLAGGNATSLLRLSTRKSGHLSSQVARSHREMLALCHCWQVAMPPVGHGCQLGSMGV